MIIVDQVRVPLAGLGADEAVEALEAAAERPAPLPRRHVRLVARRKVPLPDGVRVPATFVEHLGDGAVLERNAARVAGKSRGGLGDAGHVVAGGVAACE